MRQQRLSQAGSSRRKIDVAVILGTRPEATKLAPVIHELRRKPTPFKVAIIGTGQHREMLPETLGIFDLKTDVDLDIMSPEQSLEHVTCAALKGLEPLFSSSKPDLVLVEGDTTTVFAAGLAAYYHGVPVAHLEAGLRTDDIYSPFPEEVNRRLVSVLASVHLAPTAVARQNLLEEGHPPQSIYVTGNTAVDAVLWCAAKDEPLPIETEPDKRLVLITAHRRESWGEPLRQIFAAVKRLVRQFDDIEVVFPVHPNPKVSRLAKQMLGGTERIHLIGPLDYLPFVRLMQEAYLILTDSGGIQEEAPSLHKPILVMREKTERYEGVAAGTSILVGRDPAKIVRQASTLLTDKNAYDKMAQVPNPFGDGRGAGRVREALRHYFGLRKRRPADFEA